jgi:predicted deacylase
LPSEAERLGKITVGTELGWGDACMRLGVRFARQGVLAAAIHHRQLRGEIAPIAHHADGTQRGVEIVDWECYSPAPFAGHYQPLKDCGEIVKKGETVGLLHDFDHIDVPPCEVRAQLDGMVVVHAFRAPVAQGQHVAVIGTVVW